MYFNFLKIFTFLIIISNFFYGNSWSHITSILNVTDIAIDNNNIYASTNGGLIIIDKQSQTLSSLGLKQGVFPMDLNSILIDSKKNILLGSSGPIPSIQVLDENYNKINIILLDGIDGLIEIVDMFEYNNNIYAIGRGKEYDFFIEFIFDVNGHLNYKTVINLPLENISTIYDVDVLDNQMFITTNKGVIKGVISENNISWSIYLSDNLEKSFFNNGDLFSGQFRGEDIVDIVSFNSNQFNIITSKSLYSVVNSDTVKFFHSPYSSADFTNIYRSNDIIGISIANMGLYSLLINDNEIVQKNMYLPETTFQNKFSSITVMDDGSVVVISENGGSIIENDRVVNFIPYNKKEYYPVNEYIDDIEIGFDRYGDFFGFSTNYRSGSQTPMSIIGSDWNSIYFTNPGITPNLNNIYNSPLVEINLENYQCTNYGIGDGVIDGMNGIVDIESVDSDYMFINHLKTDSQNNIWVLNPYSENYNNILAIQTPEKSWYHIQDPYGLGLQSDNNSLLPTSFDFGPNGNIWVAFKRHLNQNGDVVSSGGIKILDYNDTIEDSSDDQWLEIDSPNILPDGSNTEIWSLAFSKNLSEDILWILTGDGVKGYIVNGLDLIEYPQNFYENIYFDEFDKLKVDAQNNVWIVTTHSGVRVISQDTSTWPSPDGITTQNSSILSNIVYDVAFNKNNGKIYFATEKGISILESPFTQNPEISNHINEISLSPNPFILFKDSPLSIWNLFAGSKVRVMTLNGTVLKTFQLSNSENKISSWNGILDNGDYIKPGIYLVTASHPDYKSRIGKLAVIK